MSPKKGCVAALAMTSALLAGAVSATTREVADLQTAPLTIRQSVISELSGDIFKDPYDELQMRPYNLPFTNLKRYGSLSPWPGYEGEETRYLNALIGNNGNTNVRNGSDVFEGSYIQQQTEALTWAVAGSYLADDVANSDSAGALSFADSEQLVGLDGRFAIGYWLSEKIRLGGGVNLFNSSDEAIDSSFEQGVGGFFSARDLNQSGVEADFGVRWFRTEASSWEGRLVFGAGETELIDFSEALDDTGAVTNRFVVTDYQTSDTVIELSGAYNRRLPYDQGEFQLAGGYRMTERTLDNTELSYTDAGGVVTPSLQLLAEDPVSRSELFAHAGTVFIRGSTQMFAGARLSLLTVEGFTRVDSLGTIVDETIDDSATALGLVVGLRQPLWSEGIRLVASAQADWINQDQATIIDNNASGTDFTQTTKRYAVGAEAVLANVTVDVAWLFGESSAPVGTTGASRQEIDVDRLVVSATLGW